MARIGLVMLLLAAGLMAQTPQGSFAYTPKWVVTASVGALVPGSGKWGADSYSAYLGQGTYATSAVRYTVTKGIVVSCPLAGVTKLLYQYKNMTVAAVGLGGACNAEPDGNFQGLVAYRIKHSNWSVGVTATKPFVAGPAGMATNVGVVVVRASE